ncbi:MAG: HAD-IC family P-type ATPase, partial [Verrucomicrobia bacterium]|nr:HAD-IC family P-type ATPase [Verrucomicrobiota bacterium]
EGEVEGRIVRVGKVDFLRDTKVKGHDVLEVPALRAQGEGHTAVKVAIDGRAIGLITLADAVKPHAPEVVMELKALGLQVVMMTGDARRTAEAVARQTGITRIHANVEPAAKAAEVRALEAENRRVAVAGDGINDAPALSAASVGIAMGTGTAVAIESAGVTLLHGDLRGLVRAIQLSRVTMKNIRQNLFFAFAYNLLGVPLAAGALYPFTGLLLSPMLAGLAMSFSSLSVVYNALRLRRASLATTPAS